MSDFHQDPPRPSQRFRTDRALRDALQRLLPAELFASAADELDALGERARGELADLADRAEANPPRHVAYDAWGRRCDRIEIDPSWLRLVEIGLESGLVALPYEKKYGEYSRVVQAGLVNLYDPVSAMATCPLVMTDGAARLLSEHDAALAARYVPRLTARRGGITCGQWMTETSGGSDVGSTATQARPLGDGRWTLHGTKWFTSATIGGIALVLARPEGAATGSRGLSLFLVELQAPGGTWNGMRVRRLKDKLGTRALPTAEIDLDGAVAAAVGTPGRAVAKLADLLNIARLWAAWSAPAGTGHLLDLAKDYASRRTVLGAPLRQRPIHRAWLARIAAEYEAMIALMFEAALTLGRAESGRDDAGLARLLAPLTKLAGARQGVWAASELLESFGGAGYLEDTGIPRILRNVHVNCIWEGTTSVLAADLLRALHGGDLGPRYVADVRERLLAVTDPAAAAIAARVLPQLGELEALLRDPREDEARRIGWGMARVLQGALLCQVAEWRIRARQDRSGLTAATLFTAEPLLAPAHGAADADLDELAFGRL